DHLLLDPVRKGTCAPPRAIYYSTRLERALVPLRVPFITRPVWKGHLCPSACHLLLDPFGKGTCAPPRAIYYSTRLERALVPLRVRRIVRTLNGCRDWVLQLALLLGIAQQQRHVFSVILNCPGRCGHPTFVFQRSVSAFCEQHARRRFATVGSRPHQRGSPDLI